MMANDGIGDYGYAKRKAARRLGVRLADALPDDGEIETALRAYQSLYQRDEQAQRLRALRAVALELMRILEPFSPYLVGRVLEGTAGRYARIDLELFADSAKDVEIFLLSHRIDYACAPARGASAHEPEARLELQWQAVPVRISVFDAGGRHVHARDRRTGNPCARASVNALQALLAGEAG